MAGRAIAEKYVAFDVTLKTSTSQRGAANAQDPVTDAPVEEGTGVSEETPHAKLVLRCGVFLFWQDLGRLSFSALISHFPSARLSLERDGGARVLLSTPARKYLQPRECFEKGGLSNPAPAILIGGGVRFSFPTPALGERRHCCLARWLIAVDGRAIFVVAVGQRPEPRHPHGRGGGLQDARATTAVRASYSGVNRSSTCKLHQTK